MEHSDQTASAIIITKRPDDFGEHTSGTGKKLLRIPAFAYWDMQREMGIKE